MAAKIQTKTRAPSSRGAAKHAGPAIAKASAEDESCAPSSSGSGAGVSAYDTAKDSPARSSVLAFPLNSRRELTPLTRREIIRKSRALEANCPRLTRIIRKYARHAVGNGIHFRFLTADRVWNDLARRDVEEWWNNPLVYSLDGGVDGWEAKRLAVEHILLDGEYNAAFVKTAADWPMLQQFDVFEIETPTGHTYDPEWDDGVHVIPGIERPYEYGIRSLPQLGVPSSGFTTVPVESMLHLGRRRRAHGQRFLPAGYSGLNMGLDALDLQALMCGTAKLHSALAVAVKGSAKKGKRGAINRIRNGDAPAEVLDTDALEKVFGSMVNYVGEKGEIDLKSSQHPGPNLLEFLQLLFGEMCPGFDVPRSVMFGMGDVGGAAGRFEAEDAQSAFDQMYDFIAWRFVRREIIWKISTSIKSGRLPQPKDPYWFTKLVMRGPRKLTADIKGMAQAFKILVRNGAMSIPRFLEEQGLDAYQEAQDNFEFLKFLKDLYEAGDVPVEWVYESTPGSVTNVQLPPNKD